MVMARRWNKDSKGETMTTVNMGLTTIEHDVKCPECGGRMRLRCSDKVRYDSGRKRLFYGCENYPTCKGSHGAHPDGKPMGIPGNQATKDARIRLHTEFDKYWKDQGLSRKESYHKIADILQVPRGTAHISNLTVEQCEFVLERIKQDGRSTLV